MSDAKQSVELRQGLLVLWRGRKCVVILCWGRHLIVSPLCSEEQHETTIDQIGGAYE